jgi:outer membrane protein assembly factor BamD
MKIFARALLVVSICFACAAPATRKGDQPQDYYEEGMTNFKNELWPEAMQSFANLKAKFPYSKFAALAELRLADIKFKNEKYLEAIDAYRLFVQYHPTHEEVGYAMYREALSHFKEIQEDWFFLPPSYEKDQTEVDRAQRLLKEVIERYPKAEFRKDAEEKLRDCRMRLAQHDLYVARFYVRKHKWRGAAARFEIVRGYVGGSALEPVVLLELGETYVKLGEKDKSRAVFAQLIERHPRSDEAKMAQQRLQE